MLSKITEHLPTSQDYLYEIKLDGQRTIAEVSKSSILLYTRNLQNVTDKYPELEDLKKCLNKKTAILDGEIVALEDGIPSFQLMQQRMSLRDLRAVRRVAQEVPVVYYVFDILELNGKSLLKMPLLERKKLLNVIKPSESIKVLPYFETSDIEKKARELGYEGVVAKKRNSAYYPGQRTDLWLKYKFQETDSFVIGGWVEGGRSHDFGSILIGKYKGKKLIHCGRAGTGFNETNIRQLMEAFRKLEITKSPFEQVPSTSDHLHWLKPKLVAEVKFKEWTNAGIVRAPVFMGLRTDIAPSECIL